MSTHARIPHHAARRGRGFSLLELSVVIAVISLIAGTGMTIANNALKTADRIGTQEKLATIKLALDSHAKTYGYLPCPASRILIPSDTNFGVENRNNYTPPSQTCTTVVNGITLIGTTLIGMVPVRTLGLPDSYASDAWGNKLTYAVRDVLAQNPSSYATALNGSIILRYKGTIDYNVSSQRSNATYTSVTSGGDASFTFSSNPAANDIVHFKPTIGVTGYNGSYWVKTSSNPTKLTTDGPGTTTYLAFNGVDTGGTIEWLEPGTNVGYIVISHGPNGLGAFPTNATTVPATKTCGGTTIDANNCDVTDAIFFDTDYNDGGVVAEYFDDYVVWGTNALFRNAVNDGVYSGATSACPTGVCEPWCAACEKNYPGNGTSIPPATFTAGSTILCKKIINSNATDCKASCFWGGIITAGTTYQPCP